MKKSQPNGQARLCYELLEPKKMLAANVAFDAATGLIEITGTAESDIVRVENLTETTIDVTVVDGGSHAFDASAVTGVIFNGRRGADDFRNTTSISITAHGGAGDDFILGGFGNDSITGGDGNDILTGKQGADSIFGGDGDDQIQGNRDDDSLFGGGGNDNIIGGQGTNLIYGGDGDDNIQGGGPPAASTAIVDSSNEIFGGDGNDFIHGGIRGDTLFGGLGNDEILGFGGEDVIRGNDGNDRIDGGSNHDKLFGNDVIFGQGGSDLIYGGAGFDSLIGHEGQDEIFGGSDNDTIYGDRVNNPLSNFGNQDVIAGGSGDDTIFGGAGGDQISGNDGDDTIDAGRGNDEVFAGPGDDSVLGGEGFDQIYGLGGDDDLRGNEHSDRIYGGDGNDFIIGGGGRDSLFGMNGVDEIYGGSGADGLVAGFGNDRLIGGEGDDRFLTRFTTTVVDLSNEDVEIQFRSQPGSQKWTTQQVHLIDFGFEAMNQHITSNKLLKDPFVNEPIVLMKVDSLQEDRFAISSVQGNNRTITIGNFESDNSLRSEASYEIAREIGLIWASDDAFATILSERPNVISEFRSLSDWTATPDNLDDYTLSGDGTEFYLNSAEFANDPHAKNNSVEDFASSWAGFFFRSILDDVNVPGAKSDFVSELLADIRGFNF